MGWLRVSQAACSLLKASWRLEDLFARWLSHMAAVDRRP